MGRSTGNVKQVLYCDILLVFCFLEIILTYFIHLVLGQTKAGNNHKYFSYKQVLPMIEKEDLPEHMSGMIHSSFL